MNTDNNKNSSNNIPSFQSMSNENIYLNEEKDNNTSSNNKNVQQSHRSIKKIGNQQGFSQSNYDDPNPLQNPKKKKEFESQSVNIVPGYKNFVLDENNAAYDSIADMFSKDEIEQAFKILDYQGNNQITTEELTFFLESIGEQARPDEIEEMIKMCDLEGKGYVTKDEFLKLASGQSLAPIGQAYPPTEEMLKKKEFLENLNLDEYSAGGKFKNSLNPNFNIQSNKTSNMNNTTKQSKKNVQSTMMTNATQNNDFTVFNQSRDHNNKSNTKNLNMDNEVSIRQKNNLNMTATGQLNTTAVNKTNVQQASSLSLKIQNKEQTAEKVKILKNWQRENKINERLGQIIKQINEIQRNNSPEDDIQEFQKEYRDFLKFFGLQDSLSNQEVYKLAQTSQPDKNSNKVDIYNFVFMLISSQESTKVKYDFSFQMMGKEIICFEDLLYIEKKLTFQTVLDPAQEKKYKDKFENHKNKKDQKSKPYGSEEMDKQFYLELVQSYPTCFQG